MTSVTEAVVPASKRQRQESASPPDSESAPHAAMNYVLRFIRTCSDADAARVKEEVDARDQWNAMKLAEAGIRHAVDRRGFAIRHDSFAVTGLKMIHLQLPVSLQTDNPEEGQWNATCSASTRQLEWMKQLQVDSEIDLDQDSCLFRTGCVVNWSDDWKWVPAGAGAGLGLPPLQTAIGTPLQARIGPFTCEEGRVACTVYFRAVSQADLTPGTYRVLRDQSERAEKLTVDEDEDCNLRFAEQHPPSWKRRPFESLDFDECQPFLVLPPEAGEPADSGQK